MAAPVRSDRIIVARASRTRDKPKRTQIEAVKRVDVTGRESKHTMYKQKNNLVE